jgi:hypothetical protein
MSRTVAAASFLATVAVIVPAAWTSLDADIRRDGKHVRPLERSVDIDGARVTLEIDRGVIFTGDRVKATLRAYADAPQQVAIELTVFDSHNYAGERVSQPEIAIDHENLVLTAAPGGGPKLETMIATSARPASPALVDTFRFIVTKRGKKADPSDYSDDGLATAASATVIGWSGNSLAISIRPEGRVREGEAFVVAVRVKNTTGRKLQLPWPQLGTRAGENSVEAGDATIQEIEDPAIDAIGADRAWKPGAVFVRRFTVTLPRSGAKHAAFVAQAFSYGESVPGPAAAGAMDVASFAIDETPPAVAVK